jgi:hypothetical protein
MNALAPIPGSGWLRIIRLMKVYIASLVLLGILAASALHGKLTAASRVTVCVEKAADVDGEGLDRGEISAGKILALVGLEIEWRNQRRSCPQERDPILLNVTTNTPRDYFPRAYGTALPFEGIHIRAFYDRIQRIRPDQVVALLGHVLAHEIVHILSGTDAHSETGVMKRRWSPSDLEQMVSRPLPFSNLDISLLNLGIRDRHARLVTIRNQNMVATAGLPSE